MKNVDKFPLY